MKKLKHIFLTIRWYFLAILFVLVCNNAIAQPAIPKKQRIVIDNMMKEGAYNEALNSLRELMPLYPDNAEIEMLAGMCYSNLSAYKDLAINTFKKALTLKPDENLKLEILFNLGNTQMNVGLYNDAIATYNELQELVPATFVEFKKQIGQKIVQCDNLIRGVTVPETKMIAQANATESKQPVASNTASTPPTPTTPLAPVVLDSVKKDSIKKDSVKSTALINTLNDVRIVKDSDVPVNVEYIYTIQICALSFPAAKNRFKEKNNIQIMKEGNIYKYFYSQYKTIDEARDSLPTILNKYPGAYITRYTKQDVTKISRYNN